MMEFGLSAKCNIRHDTRFGRIWNLAFMRVALAAWCIFLSFPNVAQAEDTRECRAALDAFSWVFDEEGSFYKLGSTHLGRPLHGVKCSPDELIQWLEENGWTHTETHSRSEVGWSGWGEWRYQSDSSVRFCKVRPFFTRWLTNGCSGYVVIPMFEGRISFIHAGKGK
ncbi:MAG: hypothetical protein ABJ246_04415 [Paracoccaceae bacterium]